MLRQCGIFLFLSVIALVLGAAPIIPSDSKVLGMTKGKPFENGMVFIDGKYIPPPYVVERWGVGIRINGKPVIGQVVEWNEFIKTQEGFKVTRVAPATPPVAEEPAAPEKTEAPPPSPPPPPKTVSVDDEDAALDDLFDDEPKPKKVVAKPAVVKAPPKPRKIVPPTPAPVYSFEGKFKPNATTKAMVEKIKAVRTEIDNTLRKGGFICFSDRYSRVSGDQRTAMQFLEKIPQLQRNSSEEREFISSVHQAGIAYLNERLCQDLFRNRVDYRALQERKAKWKKELELQKVLNRTGPQLF